MKKRIWMGLCALVTAAALVGCGADPAPAQQTPTETPAQTEATAVPETETADPASPTEGRAAQAALEYNAEGDMVQVPADLYAGKGYSIYIPAADWKLDTELEDGLPCDSWEPLVNSDVELEILRMEGRTLEEAAAWVVAEEDDYRLTEEKGGGWSGQEKDGYKVLFVQLAQSGDTVYVIRQEYPMEAMEGFGMLMRAMVDSFQLNP